MGAVRLDKIRFSTSTQALYRDVLNPFILPLRDVV